MSLLLLGYLIPMVDLAPNLGARREGQVHVTSDPRAAQSAQRTAAAPVISAVKLTKQFGARKAVDHLNFELPQGAFLSVFGANGAGKTTLMRMLATLSRPSAGTLRVCSCDALEEPEAVRSRVGLVSHSPMLYPDLTAEENLIFYAKLYGVERPQERAAELLAAVGLKSRRLDRVKTFSRGMTQRCSIARALVNSPQLVLLDEPYSGLDPHAAAELDALIERIRPGRSFVMVSHDVGKGLQLASHVLVMERGRQALFKEIGGTSADELRAACLAAAGGSTA